MVKTVANSAQVSSDRQKVRGTTARQTATGSACARERGTLVLPDWVFADD